MVNWYQPDFSKDSWRDAVVGKPGVKRGRAGGVPALVPVRKRGPGEVIFSVNCPYVLTAGELNLTVAKKMVKAAVSTAMEVAGGISFYRSFPLERMFRDIQAAHYHPLPERRQLEFTGRVKLGVSPVA